MTLGSIYSCGKRISFSELGHIEHFSRQEICHGSLQLDMFLHSFTLAASVAFSVTAVLNHGEDERATDIDRPLA